MKDKPQLKMKFLGGIFVCVYMCVCVLSLNKTAGCGGRWQHVLWAHQGGSFPVNEELPSQVGFEVVLTLANIQY